MWHRLLVRQAPRRLAAAALVLAAATAWMTSPLAAQTHTLRFQHLGTEQGLSQSSVMAIHQDREGFLWLGTQDGLDRYDGVELVPFRHSDKVASLSSNYIRALAEDSSGRLWIGTDTTGLDCFDPISGQFLNFRNRPEDEGSLASNRIRALQFDHGGKLWVATGEKGLSLFDPQTFEAVNYQNDPLQPTSLADDRLTSLLVDRAGRLWIGSRRGLDRFDAKTGTFVHYTHDPGRTDSLGDPSVRSLFEDGRGRIWVGTHGGLDLLDPALASFRHFRPDPGNPYGLSNPPIRALIEDAEGRLWVGTDQGIHIFDEAKGRFEHHRHDRSNASSLSQDVVTTFLRDRGGLLWIGTQGGGANIWDPATSSFAHIQTRPGEPSSLSSDTIQAFAEIGEKLYIGTLGGGLNVLDRRTEEISIFRTGTGKSGLADDRVMALAAESRGRLYIGTFASGLQRFDPGSGRFETWRHDDANPDSLASDSIATLLEDHQGRLWIGSFFGGLARFDEASGTFVHYRYDAANPESLPSDAITAIVEAPDSGLFIGTNGGGLSYLAADDQRIVRFAAPEGDLGLQGLDVVMSLHIDPKGSLWVGTADAGLVRVESFDPQSGEARIQRFSDKEGAPNGTIFGIQSDRQGLLWLSTNRGLISFDPQKLRFTTFTSRQGLQADDFNFGAHFSSAQGKLYFGGNHGFNAFFPEQLHSNSEPPKVVFTSIVLRERNVRPESLPGNPKELELDYQDSVFSIEFAALDFEAPEENRYRFRLDGFDEAWSQPTKNRPATFTNLDPGQYLFHVTAANANGVWNKEGATLKIHVLPAPWETWWAWTLYVLVASALGWSGIRWRLAGLERSGRELQALVDQRTGELSQTVEQLRLSEQSALDAKMRALRALEDALEERRKAQEASRAKSTFLSNVSHELRTPLNAVLGFAQLMERDETLRGEHRENLGVILRSGEHLLGLINDVLSFAKIESGRLTLKEAPFELRRVVRDVEDMMRVRADAKGLRLDVEVESALPNVRGDEGRLTQILLNLLGNAVKFTSKGGLRLVVSWQNNSANFKVIDTGCGIADDEIDKLFQPFVQARAGRQNGEGTGLGLAICHKLVALMGGQLEVHSEVGVGSTFDFTIPLLATALSDSAPRRGRVLGLAPNQPSARILVADDAAENRNLLLRLLDPLGLEVRLVANGQEAVETWSVWRPHLILMDIRMPILDGYGAIRRIRQAEAELGGRTVILAITATAFEHDRRRMLATGCDNVLTKPFRSQALFDLLTEHLELRFLYQETAPGAGNDEEEEEADFAAEVFQPLAAAPSASVAGPPDPAPRGSSAQPSLASTPSPKRPTPESPSPKSTTASWTALPSETEEGSLPLAGCRILVVEDNDANRLVAQRALERLGCLVDLARDGLEALEAAGAAAYHLIFMDLQMPRLDGIAAAKRLRSEEGPSRKTPIVALTGLPTADEHRRCQEAGMNDLLAKPFRLDDLRRKVEKWAIGPESADEDSGPNLADVDAFLVARAAYPSQEPYPSEAPKAQTTAGSADPPAQPSKKAQPASSEPAPEQDLHRALEDTREVYVAEIIKLFLETAPFQLETLRMAAASLDTDRLAHLAATLRGSSLNFSADELAAACERLEALCENAAIVADKNQIGDAIDDLALELQGTIQTLRQRQTRQGQAKRGNGSGR